jgi:hypothetical protein
MAQQYLLPATVGGPLQWSHYEPEYDNDGNVIFWHETPADPPITPSGFNYLHPDAPSAEEVLAAMMWLTIPQLINFSEWDGRIVHLDEMFPPSLLSLDFHIITRYLNLIKGWRFGAVIFGRDFYHWCIMK